MRPAWTLPMIVLGLLLLIILGGVVIALIWEANAEAWNPIVGYLAYAVAELTR